MNLWLDDLRPAPAGWTWAKTVAAAKTLLATQVCHEMSLDHDLGGNQPSGYDLVKWMAKENCWPICPPAVHSMNVVGRQNIEAVIKRYGPYDKRSDAR